MVLNYRCNLGKFEAIVHKSQKIGINPLLYVSVCYVHAHKDAHHDVRDTQQNNSKFDQIHSRVHQIMRTACRNQSAIECLEIDHILET